jgi:hypothetical protein
LYYIPHRATSHSTVNFYSIKQATDPYTITDANVTDRLKAILEDSLAKKYIGKFKEKNTYETRIVMNVYRHGKLTTRYGILYGGKKMVINDKKYSIENIRSLLLYIKQNFQPVTDKQKASFLFPYNL